MIPNFNYGTHCAEGAEIAYCWAGSGPALLLLHGFPQTHMMWAKIAPELISSFTVICTDLRGYGASSKPHGTKNYSFRQMALDQLSLLSALGFATFHVVGHDRGGRVAHRLALDAPAALSSLTVMDIVPTHHLLQPLDFKVAQLYYHWFFLAQPAPFPEKLIAANADYYYTNCLMGWGAGQLDEFSEVQLAAYRAAWHDPDTIRGMCEDYRAALEFDFDLDTADLSRKVTCPALVLSGADGIMEQAFDMSAAWQPRLANMRYRAIRGGHFFVDQNPSETLTAMTAFLTEIEKSKLV